MTKPSYIECFTAYIDILGFRSLVERSINSPDILSSIYQAAYKIACQEGSEHYVSRFNRNGEFKCKIFYKMQINVFSDCVVLFVPIKARDGLNYLLGRIRSIHDHLIEHKCLIRGAITVGKMYYDLEWDTPSEFTEDKGQSVNCEASNNAAPHEPLAKKPKITLGPALIDAYKHESEVAIYPRIVMTDKLIEFLQANPEINDRVSSIARSCKREFQGWVSRDSFGSDEINTVLTFARTDADGVRHFDLLHPEISRGRVVKDVSAISSANYNKKDNTRDFCIKEVRQLCESRISAINIRPKVRQKYEWLLNYYLSHYPD